MSNLPIPMPALGSPLAPKDDHDRAVGFSGEILSRFEAAHPMVVGLSGSGCGDKHAGCNGNQSQTRHDEIRRVGSVPNQGD